jgi:hypothetical protein
MADEDLLQSWKEIAGHLGRSERTCRRWETEFGLPVHRMDGSIRGSVFAYKSELDRWMDTILHKENPAQPPKKRFTARWMLPVILALLVVAAVAVILAASRGCSMKPPEASSFTLSIPPVLPVTSNTEDDSLDFSENAQADLIDQGNHKAAVVDGKSCWRSSSIEESFLILL